MYAVIRTGGKQYRVAPGQRLRVERLPGAEGDDIELTEVLMLGGAEGVTIGAPTVDGARVVAEITSQGRDKKVLVFKFKSKKRYRRLRGHKQLHTLLFIREIVAPDGTTHGVGPRRAATAEDTASDQAQPEAAEAAVERETDTAAEAASEAAGAADPPGAAQAADPKEA